MSEQEYTHWRLEHDDEDIAWLYIDKADANTNVLSADVLEIVSLCRDGGTPSEAQVERLFRARGVDFSYVCQQANAL